jgi:hypothetical protein
MGQPGQSKQLALPPRPHTHKNLQKKKKKKKNRTFSKFLKQRFY